MSFIYKKGEIPVIILSLHGGHKSLNCKKRTNTINGKQYVVKNDTNTKEIAQKTYNELIKLGLKPYLLINEIQRKFIDLNREINHACNQNCEGCVTQYILFHDKLQNMVLDIINNYGKCFIFDVHGNKHTHNMVQFGYNLTTKQILDNKLDTFSYFTHKDKNNTIKEKYIYKKYSLSYVFRDLFDNIYPTYNKLDNSYIINNGYKYYSGKQHIVKKYSEICDVVLLELSPDVRRNPNTPIKLAMGLYRFYNQIYTKHF